MWISFKKHFQHVCGILLILNEIFILSCKLPPSKTLTTSGNRTDLDNCSTVMYLLSCACQGQVRGFKSHCNYIRWYLTCTVRLTFSSYFCIIFCKRFCSFSSDFCFFSLSLSILFCCCACAFIRFSCYVMRVAFNINHDMAVS